MSQIVPLQFLRAGEVGRVIDITGADQLVTRLAESGLRAGSRLEILSVGEPVVCRVDETKLSLRMDGRVEVMVRVPA